MQLVYIIVHLSTHEKVHKGADFIAGIKTEIVFFFLFLLTFFSLWNFNMQAKVQKRCRRCAWKQAGRGFSLWQRNTEKSGSERKCIVNLKLKWRWQCRISRNWRDLQNHAWNHASSKAIFFSVCYWHVSSQFIEWYLRNHYSTMIQCLNVCRMLFRKIRKTVFRCINQCQSFK